MPRTQRQEALLAARLPGHWDNFPVGSGGAVPGRELRSSLGSIYSQAHLQPVTSQAPPGRIPLTERGGKWFPVLLLLLPLECLLLAFLALCEAGRSLPLGLFRIEQLGLTSAFPQIPE